MDDTNYKFTKYVYKDKLDDIVNKYNNTNDSTIKMKPVEVRSNRYSNSTILKILMINILNLKLVILLKY